MHVGKFRHNNMAGMRNPMSERYVEKLDPWSSHSIIYGWLSTCPAGTRVLDVGTASGMVGRRFAEIGWVLKGVEFQPEYAAAARQYYSDFYQGSITDAPDAFLEGQEVVICADILEHTPDPQAVLTRLVQLQRPDGQFILSVPNVANLWVRLNLLFGKFDYTENGILDRTHLRFFTKKTFLQLVDRSGLKIEELRFTPVPLPLVNAFFEKNAFGRLLHTGLARLTNLFPTLLAYQFVARANLK